MRKWSSRDSEGSSSSRTLRFLSPFVWDVSLQLLVILEDPVLRQQQGATGKVSINHLYRFQYDMITKPDLE